MVLGLPNNDFLRSPLNVILLVSSGTFNMIVRFGTVLVNDKVINFSKMKENFHQTALIWNFELK